MGFFDDITKKISMVGQEAATQTKVFAEKTRINTKISDEERQLNSIFQLIGKNYYEANKDNPNAEYKDQILTIKDAYVRIDGLKEQLRMATGIRVCPNCSAEVVQGSAFCNSCGSKMPAETMPSAPVVPQGDVCPQCGNSVAFGAAFCNICGSKMPEIQRQPLGSYMMGNSGSFSTPGYDTTMNQKSDSLDAAVAPAMPIMSDTPAASAIPVMTETPVVPAAPAAPIIPDIPVVPDAQPMPIPVPDNPEFQVPKKTVSIEKKD